MLSFLLDRGECLNEVCGPGGAALHACIIGVHLNMREHPLGYTHRPIRQLLARGVVPNVSGPGGTPLQLIRRLSRAPSERGVDLDKSDLKSKLDYSQTFMKLL